MPKYKVKYSQMETEANLHTSSEWAKIFGISTQSMMALVSRNKWNVKRVMNPKHLENFRNAVKKRDETNKDEHIVSEGIMIGCPPLEWYFSKTLGSNKPIKF